MLRIKITLEFCFVVELKIVSNGIKERMRKRLLKESEKDFHTDKYKIRTIMRTMQPTYMRMFFHLNSLRINASRGGEIKS